MATIVSRWSPSSQEHIRPFDARRDLEAAADLIELCFADNLSIDGRRYLARMRNAAKVGRATHWQVLQSGFPLGGLVWEQDGRLVGNLSLIPFWHRGRALYLIANVAVHPDYRRRGIARQLTEAALEKARRRFASEVWLHVRDDNPAAFALYTSVGFLPQTRRTSWVVVHASQLEGESPSGVRVTPRWSRHWRDQVRWLEANYPPALRWNYPLKMGAMRPGIWGMLYRFFVELPVRHWAVERDGKLLGVLSWQPSSAYADRLWLAAPAETEEIVLRAALPFIRDEGRLRRPLALEYPVDRAAETLRAAGFELEYTLVWMKMTF